MIIRCGFKQGDFCDYYRKPLEKIWISGGTEGCEACRFAVPVYTGKNKVELLYKAFHSANKEKSARDVDLMRCVYGHCAAVVDDADYIYCDGYTVWLVLHKKYKYIDKRQILRAKQCMQLMNMRIPKRIRREVRRIKRNG